MPRLRWWVLTVFGLWTIFVWTNRILNVWRDLLPSTEEKAVTTVMAASFVVLGLIVVVLSLGLRTGPPTRVDHAVVGILAGWTAGVWAVRVVAIVGGGHDLPFVVVHVALAVVSVALAALSWRELARVPVPASVPLAPGDRDESGIGTDASASGAEASPPATDGSATGAEPAVPGVGRPAPAGSVAGTDPQ